MCLLYLQRKRANKCHRLCAYKTYIFDVTIILFNGIHARKYEVWMAFKVIQERLWWPQYVMDHAKRRQCRICSRRHTRASEEPGSWPWKWPHSRLMQNRPRNDVIDCPRHVNMWSIQLGVEYPHAEKLGNKKFYKLPSSEGKVAL